jgi:replication factor C large subunit
MDWAEKFRPQHLRDMIGNESALRQMAGWARDWNRQKRPLILYGKPGIGKTTAAHALARDLGWEAIELNASDQRTKAVIDRVAGWGSTTGSLTGAKRKLIILDEADNIHGTADRGGARAIIDIIRESRQPIILIANDLYGVAPEIRQLCDPIRFKAVQARSIVPRLRHICSAEGVSCSDPALRGIADDAGGDIRAAVNMLYASAIGRETLEERDVYTSRKDGRASIFDLISAVFGKADDARLTEISREVEEEPDTIEQWVEGSLAHLPGMHETALAYRYISRADEYVGYTFRRQYYTLWRYATSLILIGVSHAAGGKGIHARIMPPERWGRMGRSRKQKASRSALMRKLAGMMRMPQSTIREGYFDSVTLLAAADPEYYAETLGLDADQLAILIRNRERAQQVIKAIAIARKQREKEQAAAEKDRTGEVKQRAKPMGTDALAQAPAPEPEPVPPGEPKRDAAISTGTPESPESQAGTRRERAKTQSTLFNGF